jgi:5'(3')-deoxyribonucleotidase
LPKNLLHFEGQGLLFTAPHNVMATDFVRVNHWREVAEYFATVVAGNGPTPESRYNKYR